MANNLELIATYIPHLKTQFARGSVVLFTGAGFSLGAVNVAGDSLPSALKLTRLLWEICYPGVPFDETTQLQDIYDAALQQHRAKTESLLRHSFTVGPERCPDYYRRLFAMPWSRIYTLNIDDLAEKVSGNTHGRPMKSVSATSQRFGELNEKALSIIH
jgi:hypothetical protein